MQVTGAAVGWTAKVRRGYDSTMEWIYGSGSGAVPLKRAGSSSALVPCGGPPPAPFASPRGAPPPASTPGIATTPQALSRASSGTSLAESVGGGGAPPASAWSASSLASSFGGSIRSGLAGGGLAGRTLPFRLPPELWGAFNAVSYALNHLDRRSGLGLGFGRRRGGGSGASPSAVTAAALPPKHAGSAGTASSSSTAAAAAATAITANSSGSGGAFLGQCRSRPASPSRLLAPPPSATGAGAGAAAIPATGPLGPYQRSASMDARPDLTFAETLQCLLITAVVCVAYYWYAYGWTAQLSARVSLHIALLATACLTVSRNAFLESHYEALQRPEAQLGDPDSLFVPLDGMVVHAKVKRGPAPDPGAPRLAIHCYHGFGANVFSWQAVQKPLAWALNAQVSSHDMPGFGLTQRPAQVPKYSLSTNGRLGRTLMDQQLAQWAAQVAAAAAAAANGGDGGGADAGSGGGQGASSNKEVRRVLMGHSLGCACIAAEVINNPEGVSAIVLLAPAILASGRPGSGGAASPGASALQAVEGAVEEAASSTPAAVTEAGLDARSDRSRDAAAARGAAAAGEDAATTASKEEEEGGGGGGGFNPLAPLAHGVSLALSTVAAALILALRPLLVVLLRLAVRNRDFWEKGLQGAWHEPSLVTRQVVDAYRMPQLVRGWEAGMVRFLLARASILSPLWRAFSASRWGVAEGEAGGASQVRKLAAAVRRHGIKVLIVHGESDMLVPPSNSRRLAELIPGARLVVLPRCGHVPAEECPREVMAHVTEFVGSLAC